jgi:hypothetical protein
MTEPTVCENRFTGSVAPARGGTRGVGAASAPPGRIAARVVPGERDRRSARRDG